jgi:hypothetical protein
VWWRRGQGNLARYRFALSFPCSFACACAVALLTELFEASFKFGDAFLGERQLIGGQGAGHVGGLGKGKHGGVSCASWGLRAGWGSSLNHLLTGYSRLQVGQPYLSKLRHMRSAARRFSWSDSLRP